MKPVSSHHHRYQPLRAREQDGHTEPGADLDEEMEKVFTMGGDKFDVAKFGASPDSSSGRSFGEKDFIQHRKKSYPHPHIPKSLLSRPARKRDSSPRESESEKSDAGTSAEVGDSRKMSAVEMSLDEDPCLPSVPSSSTAANMPGASSLNTPSPEDVMLSSESEPQVSERAASFADSPLFGSPVEALRRVQFQIGEGVDAGGNISETTDAAEPQRRDSVPKNHEKKKRKHSRHHHRHASRKYSLPEETYLSRKVGPEFDGVLHPGDVSNLQEHDLDDLTSHRFDDSKGIRRFKIQPKISNASVVHIGRKDGLALEGVLPLASLKKTYDHSPHEIFVQLDELHGLGDEREWKETARWIKYEEDVEEGADRWGRPHVASLSFHSLLNLRRCLETGVVLLDLEEKDLPGVAYRVVEQMVVDELIKPEDKPTVMRALLLRHRHVNEHDRFRFAVRRNVASYTSLQNLNEEKGKPKIIPSNASFDTVATVKLSNSHPAIVDTLGKPENHVVDVKEETYTSSVDDLKKIHNDAILKRIPVGAEATTVLVGALDFLEQPTIAFVRLAEGVPIPALTEVSIPVRFMFILLGPNTADLDYHEIGRSISTLMSNAYFHSIAYRAEERKELLSAINEFLDDSIVLPPGDWERKALLPFTELKAKSEKIRRRRNKSIQMLEGPHKALLIAGGDGDGGKPPGDDPLRRTRRPFGGLINDIKRRFPFYKSDILDGLNSECFAAIIFIYFACVSTAITFGGIMGGNTNNSIGISETLISTSVAGIIFALLSGQPLIIIGTTGPLLIFDESLFNFCLSNGLNFLATRTYIGLWLGLIALVVSSFEGSVLVKLFTRFTEEIFAALIALLYMVDSFTKVYMVFKKFPLVDDYCTNGFVPNASNVSYPEDAAPMWADSGSGLAALALTLVPNDTAEEVFSSSTDNSVIDDGLNMQVNVETIYVQPNTALFCLILSLGTFFIAYYLRHFRNSKFLGRNARRALGDFGVPIAIVVMVLMDFLFPTVYTEKLKVPQGLQPSSPSERGWIISPVVSEAWIPFATVFPAMLVYILLFMETHICELIVSKKERKLKKGTGFHLDIVIVSLLNIGCGFTGAPWMCAATVRSIAHVSAITVMSRTHAPGERPHIIEVKEQRLSALLVAFLIGMSVLMAPLLRLVPMSVLYGVFLYMGVSSTSGIQFFDRLQLIFMPVKHHPQSAYVRRVKTMKMHMFTLIQIFCLAVLWVVKSTRISLAFPFFLVLMIPLRAQLKYIFSPAELHVLDSQEVDPDSQDRDDEPDFYDEAPLPG
ncbi:band 3 anion transport protein isoform X2 [Bacillus rossius redtenbacheri]|uniref:band 3 anion transport protein isoform X2 n=1 Tax=Bacillus rossius redtenbacheri TaxID=93214 RepID=UPI002FDC7CAD